jgi:hypothetical protein
MSRRNGRIEIERENTKRERHHRNHRAARTAVEKDHGVRDNVGLHYGSNHEEYVKHISSEF